MTAAQTTIAIEMPRLSDSMEEATILTWLKAPGDAVAEGDELVEIETDKATMVYEAEQDGVLGALLVGEGEVAALGAPIAELLVVADAADAADAAGTDSPPAATPAAGAPASPPAASPPSPPVVGRVRATPVARRVAEQLGVELAALAGSGPRGRVVRADVLAAADTAPAAAPAVAPPAASPAAAPPAPIAVGAGDERVALTSTQRTIARRMVASRSEIPEFTLTAEIDMTDALALRRQLVDAGHRVSVNDVVVKAVAIALREHPRMNASWAGDAIVRHARVNVGIAVATDDALLVPVIADADRKDLVAIANEARAAGERARTRSSTPDELSGGTFTVTNLGMFGVLSFDPVIDLPQAGILAVGTVVRRPTFAEDGAVVGRDLMHVNLSSDHRAVYGSDAARFLARLRELLEHPLLLMMPPPGGTTTGGLS